MGLKRRDHDDLTHETTAEGSKPAEISRIPPSSARPRRLAPPTLKRAGIVAGIVTPNEPRVVVLTESSPESSLQRAFMDSTISVKITDERSSGLRDVRSSRWDGSTARKGGSRKGGIPKKARVGRNNPAIALTVIALGLLGELGRVDEALAFTE